jgi:hypothetical protein
VPRATFLLPGGAAFGAQRLPAGTARMLGRADVASAPTVGRRAQLRRHFTVPANAWPIAALSRQADVGDAAGAVWLRADPAYLRPDINGVRLLAHGGSLGVDPVDAEALLPALKPLFGDAGMLLDAPVADRWYLRLPAGARVPDFSDPGEALGADLFEHQAAGDDGRRWRALAGEAQILLHNHPWNAARAAAGKLPVNALWFWGGGALPAMRPASADAAQEVFGDEPTLRALAVDSGLLPLPQSFRATAGDALYDLTAMRDLAALDRDWLQPALEALLAGRIARIELDGEDGVVRTLRRWQRWRVWRRPVAGLGP